MTPPQTVFHGVFFFKTLQRNACFDIALHSVERFAFSTDLNGKFVFKISKRVDVVISWSCSSMLDSCKRHCMALVVQESFQRHLIEYHPKLKNTRSMQFFLIKMFLFVQNMSCHFWFVCNDVI